MVEVLCFMQFSGSPEVLFFFSSNNMQGIFKGGLLQADVRKVFVHCDLFCYGNMGAQLLCCLLKVKCLIFPLFPLLPYCLFVFLKAEIRAKASRMSIF